MINAPELGTEIARGNPEAIALWDRSCKAAPYLSEKKPPYYTGDLCWPDGANKDDLSQMIVFDGKEWLTMEEAGSRTYNIQAQPYPGPAV